MKMSGTTTLHAPIDQVWLVLTDPEQLSHCLPGLSSWETVEPEQAFRLFIIWGDDNSPRLKVPILLRWTYQQPPTELHLSGQITTGSTVTEANGTLCLTAVSVTQTDIDFTAVVEPAHPMIDQMARNLAPQIANAFFKRLQQKLPRS